MNESVEFVSASNESRETFRRLAEDARRLKQLSKLKALKLNERRVNYDPAHLNAITDAAADRQGDCP